LKFGFIVHPLHPIQARLLGLRSGDPALLLKGRSRKRPGRLISRLKLKDPFGQEVEGLLLGIPHLPEALLSNQTAGIEAILDAAQLAQELGAELLGLGALCAIIGGQGKAISRALKIPVTTGNGLSAVASLGLLDHCRLLGSAGLVELMGPPGPLADAILKLLIARGEEVHIISPKPPKPLQRRVERLNERGPGRASFVSVSAPTPLLFAASSTGGKLKASSLPPGKIVVDVAAPQDLIWDQRRRDLLVLDGEYLRLPTPLRSGLWQRLYGLITGQDRQIFACFAEPMLLSLSRRPDLCSVGREIPLSRLLELERLASAHGFWSDGFFEGRRRLSPRRVFRALKAERAARLLEPPSGEPLQLEDDRDPRDEGSHG